MINTLNKLCVHSTDGYEKTIKIFDLYKSLSNERHRFKCVIDTIRFAIANSANADSKSIANNEKMIINCLMFINNLINQTKLLHERIRIRYEFLGLKLDDIFHKLT